MRKAIQLSIQQKGAVGILQAPASFMYLYIFSFYHVFSLLHFHQRKSVYFAVHPHGPAH